MKRADGKTRGQPLYALAGLVGAWMVVRVVIINVPSAAYGDNPIAYQGVFSSSPTAAVEGQPADRSATAGAEAAPVAIAPSAPAADFGTDERALGFPQAMPRPLATPLPSIAPPPVLAAPMPAPTPLIAPDVPSAAPVAQATGAAVQRRPNPMLAGGHQLLFLSAFSQIPVPDVVRTANAASRGAEPATTARRWSGDGWLLLRRGGGAPALAAIGGSYGASQAGMVLRYRIDTTSPLRPTAYLRASAALGGVREQEAALGLSTRPLRGVPIAAMGEMRVTRSFGANRVRPAVALVSELPPVALPLRLKAESYAQAGWVGGTGATAFVDGQMRIERDIARIAGAEFSAGGGLWGGAQKGASRLDAGPTARVTLHPTTQSTVRLAADWRFRLAGKAAPQSGPAITLSAGF
ncbi:MAG: hypothetical protein ACKOPQ_08740 [Novosphingobium sp.]